MEHFLAVLFLCCVEHVCYYRSQGKLVLWSGKRKRRMNLYRYLLSQRYIAYPLSNVMLFELKSVSNCGFLILLSVGTHGNGLRGG